MARGLTNKEIASQIYLAEGTVKNYITSILQKTGARDRTQAALLAKDLGLVSEYHYDTRGHHALSNLQDDFLAAVRFAFNDVASTEILAGVLFDRTNNSKFYSVEASRRFGEHWKLELEGRLYSGAPRTDWANMLKDDDHIRTELRYYF